MMPFVSKMPQDFLLFWNNRPTQLSLWNVALWFAKYFLHIPLRKKEKRSIDLVEITQDYENK